MAGPMDERVAETRQQLRAPWAAGTAGLAFAVLFVAAVVLIRTLPVATGSDAEIVAWFASGGDTPAQLAGLYLAPFAGVAFLWFVAVIRDQIGEREDRFFATVFLGSGILFVAVFFAATAFVTSLVVGVRFLDQLPPTAAEVRQARSLAYTFMFAIDTRAAAVFMVSTATIGLRSRTFPSWFALVGYAVAVALLVIVSFFDWIVLIFPAWVAFASAFILLRQWRRRGSTLSGPAAGPSPPDEGDAAPAMVSS